MARFIWYPNVNLCIISMFRQTICIFVYHGVCKHIKNCPVVQVKHLVNIRTRCQRPCGTFSRRFIHLSDCLEIKCQWSTTFQVEIASGVVSDILTINHRGGTMSENTNFIITEPITTAYIYCSCVIYDMC